MELNKYIDHTLLKPEATKEQITKLCQEAEEGHWHNRYLSLCIQGQGLSRWYHDVGQRRPC